MLDLASILTAFRPLILWLLAAVLGLPWLTGCGPKAANVEEFKLKLDAISESAYQWGLEAQIDGTVGDGHVAGQAFNVTGMHASFHLKGKPRKTDSQPSIFDAP